MSGQINEAFETTDENFSAQQYNNETLGLPSYAFLYQNDMENLSNYDSLWHSLRFYRARTQEIRA